MISPFLSALRGLYMVLLFGLAGCAAAYTPPPLTTAHPAHPEAPSAPEQPQSTTLSYRAPDLPRAQPADQMAQHGASMQMGQGMQHGASMQMGQGMQHGASMQPGTRQETQTTHPSSQPGQQAFVGEGTVIAVVPSSHQLVINHGAITGFMDAMTMGYRTEPAALLEGLKTGDRIRFTIDARQKAIVKIDKLAP